MEETILTLNYETPVIVIPAKAGIQDLSDFTGFPVGSALDYDRGMGMTENEFRNSQILKRKI